MICTTSTVSRFALPLALFALLLASAVASAQNQYEPLGGLGHPDKLVLRGCAGVTASELRAAITRDWMIQLVSAPSSPRPAYLKTLQERVRAGYVNSGYPDAVVKASYDPQRSANVVEIDEGDRFVAGPIEFTGNAKLDQAAIIRALTEQGVPRRFATDFGKAGRITIGRWKGADDKAARPLWPAGKPARMHEIVTQYRATRLLAAFYEQGYFWPTYRLTYKRVDGEMRMVVHIEDLGPVARVGDIDIVGARHHTAKQILDYLALDTGMSIDLGSLDEVHRKLWTSGRFQKHEVRTTGMEGVGKVRLTIVVKDFEDLPKLGEALSDVDRAALRLGRWVDGMAGRPEDLCIDLRLGDVDMALRFHEKRGGVVRLGLPVMDEDGGAEGDELELGMVATVDKAGIYALNLGRKFVGGIGEHVVRGEIKFLPAEETADGNRSSIGFGLGLGSDRAGDAPPLVVDRCMAPFAFLNLASEREGTARARIEDGNFVAEVGPGMRFVSDARTGRLIALTIPAEDGGVMSRVWFERGAMKEMITALEAAAPEGNDREGGAPLASGARLALVVGVDVIGRLTGADAAQATAMARIADKLIGPNVVKHLALASPTKREAAERFTIPTDPRIMGRLGSATLVLPMLQLPDAVFDREDWPWAVSRLPVYLLVGQVDLAKLEMKRLYGDSDVGPIGSLAAAATLKPFSGDFARLFANRGQDQLDAEAFAADWDVLFGGKAKQSAFLRAVMANFRKLGESDIEALAGALPEASGLALRGAWAAARTDAQTPIADSATARAAMWAVVKPIVERQLRELARVAAP